jgi:uncharacterized protein (DUF58 family)
MPTKRTTALLVAAGLFYLFANQTQVGWMYVMSALLAGMVFTSGLLNRIMLRTISAVRCVGSGADEALFEGDLVTIRLTIQNPHYGSVAQLSLRESCPLVAPNDPLQTRKLFVPSIRGQGQAEFHYEVELYRRGVHTFPVLSVSSRAPFGFFRSERSLPAVTRTIVYPEMRPLRHFSLFDRQPTPEMAEARPGIGAEVIGVREYRSGDSPRRIHWRSVARRGQLISREFAEERQPGLTLALDLFAHPYPSSDHKQVPFEWAVKAAVSIADFAIRRGYPLHLVLDEGTLPLPYGPLSWHMMLEAFARAEPTGVQPLKSVLDQHHPQQYVAAVLPWPDQTVIESLLDLRQRGYGVIAILINPATFPEGGPDAQPLKIALAADGIDHTVIGFGDDWAESLAAPLYRHSLATLRT